jgi:NADPH:quinone reductase-like Zn-dependent oxidoreductase
VPVFEVATRPMKEDAMGERHKAVVFSEYGDASVLRLVEREVTQPAAGQVRVAVHAAGLNPIDWKIRSGAAAAWMPVELPQTPGIDLAGVIEEVSEGVTGFRPGDEVFGMSAGGSYAEKAFARADRLAAKPAGMSWELAASLPVVAVSAWHALDALALASEPHTAE